MTSIEKRGRLYVVAFIATVLLFDFSVKVLLLLGGTLRLSQLGGTVVALITCWFFWRGSKFAHRFLVVCIAAAIAFVQFGFPQAPVVILVLVFTVLGLLLLALVAPATRQFMVFQRSHNQVQPSIAADA